MTPVRIILSHPVFIYVLFLMSVYFCSVLDGFVTQTFYAVSRLRAFFSLCRSQFLSSIEGWVKSCGETGFPTTTQELEMAIHNHQNLYEQVTTAYTEVRGSCIMKYELYKSM